MPVSFSRLLVLGVLATAAIQASPTTAAPLIDGATVTLTPVFASGAVQPTLSATESNAVEFVSIANYGTSVDISNNFLDIFYQVTGQFASIGNNFNGFQIKAQGYTFLSASQTSGVPLTGVSISSDGSALLLNLAGESISSGQSSRIAFSTLAQAIPAVPEPATWAMMILGMGAVGYAMRRRQSVRVSYAA